MPDAPRTHASPGTLAARKAREQQQARRRAQLPQQRLLNTARWRKFRVMMLADQPVCQDCERVPACEVHHLRKLVDHPEDLTDPEFVRCLCESCHSKRTARGE